MTALTVWQIEVDQQGEKDGSNSFHDKKPLPSRKTSSPRNAMEAIGEQAADDTRDVTNGILRKSASRSENGSSTTYKSRYSEQRSHQVDTSKRAGG